MEKINTEFLQQEIKKIKQKVYEIACIQLGKEFVDKLYHTAEYEFDGYVSEKDPCPVVYMNIEQYQYGDTTNYYVTVPYSELNEPLSYFIEKEEEKKRKTEEEKRLKEEQKKKEEEKRKKRYAQQEYEHYLKLKEKYENGRNR